MTDKTNEPEKIDNFESDQKIIDLSVTLPEVSETVADYHDSEILANDDLNSEKTEEESVKSDAVTVSENSDSGVDLEKEREKARGIKDDKGKEYDPALHVFPPEKTPSGIWKKIPKSQRKKSDDGKEVLPTQTNTSILRSAEKMANLYDTVHVMVFGTEAKADSKQLGKLTDSFNKYFQEAGAIDLPPHLDLAFTCVSHTTEICKRPTILERLQGKLAVFTVKRQLKKALKQKQISEGQFAEAKHYLSQGMDVFMSWQKAKKQEAK